MLSTDELLCQGTEEDATTIAWQVNSTAAQQSGAAGTTSRKMFSTPELVVWPQPVCFLSFPFAQKVLALRQGTEPKYNFSPETINKIPTKLNETS